eukprot:345044_1
MNLYYLIALTIIYACDSQSSDGNNNDFLLWKNKALEEKYQVLFNENKDLRNKVSKLSNSMEDRKLILQSEIDQLEKTIENKTMQLETSQTHIKQLKGINNIKQDDIRYQKDQIKLIQKEKNKWQSELNDLNSEINYLKQVNIYEQKQIWWLKQEMQMWMFGFIGIITSVLILNLMAHFVFGYKCFGYCR